MQSVPYEKKLGIDINMLWTQQLYREYHKVVYQYNLSLAPAVLRVVPLGGCFGTWSALLRTISIDTALIAQYPWDIVVEILKHEMAHQMVTEVFRVDEAHGPRFVQACHMLGVADWAVSASGQLPQKIPSWRQSEMSLEEERLLKKVQKLLALATSSNEHEALSAMRHVQILYEKYNLDHIQQQAVPNMVYAVITRKRKRVDAVESLLIAILVEHFFVQAVYYELYDSADLCSYRAVEILGLRENVMMAEYVYDFLWHKIHELWGNFDKQQVRNKTRRDKRSYLLGLLSGFSEKLRASKPAVQASFSPREYKSLMLRKEKQLDDFLRKRHPATRMQSSKRGYTNATVFSAGVQEGTNIVLHKGVTTQQSARGYLFEK